MDQSISVLEVADFYFFIQILIENSVKRSDATFFDVWSWSALFALCPTKRMLALYGLII